MNVFCEPCGMRGSVEGQPPRCDRPDCPHPRAPDSIASPSAQPQPEEAARDESDCKCPACVPGQDLPGLLRALSDQKQCDEDGVMCEVSRQAVDEAIAIIRQHLKSAPEPSVAGGAESKPLPDYRGFALALFEATDWPEGGDLDGFDFQECAERFGLLIATKMEKPCSEDNCSCADNGAEFPAICLRKNLAAHPGIVPGWVKCSERMPNGVDWFCEPIDSVVVASFTETGFCLFWRKARYVVTKEGVRYADEGWYDGDEKLPQPTHWMPLPSAPKGLP